MNPVRLACGESGVSEKRIQIVIDEKKCQIGTGSASFSSSGSKWAGFLLEKPNHPQEFHTARFWTCNDLVALHLGPSRVRYKVGSRSHNYAQTPGSILISPRNYEYTDGSVYSSLQGDRLAVELDRSILKRVLEGSDDCSQIQLAHHDGLHDPRISTLIRLMEFEVTAGCPTGRLYDESLSLALLSYLTSRYSVINEKREGAKSTLSPKKLQIVTDYIYAHLNSNISLTELSGLIPTSAYTFCRLFRNTTGVTPHQYLIGVRIEEAKRFLAEGKRSIAEVSLLLGFANQSHFTRTFGRITGIPPRRYRYEKFLK